jgi:hypothetical protein
MVDLMRWTMMRSTTSLPPVIPSHPRVGGEKAGVAISTLGVVSTLLPGGEGEIIMSAWRSRSPDDLPVMTPRECC